MHAGPDDLTLALQSFSSASRELLTRVARRLGLGATDVTALYLLEQHGPLGVAELAQRLGIRTASATTLVDRLEAAGHVERSAHPTDRRRTRVSLLDAAREANHAEWEPSISALDAVSRSLQGHERAVVLGYLERATAAMAADLDRHGAVLGAPPACGGP